MCCVYLNKLQIRKRILSTIKMPHPHFNTPSEENSYWRHYDNYMEGKKAEEEDAKYYAAKRLEKKKNKKQPPAPQPKPNRQGLVAAEDGWFTVVSTKKH